MDRWMDKEDVVHIYNGILLNHKKEWNSAICSNMDGPRDYHTKWSKSERERRILYHIPYMWNIKCDANELTYEREKTHWCRKQTCGCQGGGMGEGWNGSLGLADADCSIWDRYMTRFYYI